MVDRAAGDRRPPRAAGRPAPTAIRCARAGRPAGARRRTAPSGSEPAASSSSAKNGFPSDRRAIRSTSEAGAGRPWMAASWSASSSAVEPLSSTRSTRGSRSISASHGREGMAAMELVGAIGQDDEHPFVAEATGDERQQVARRSVGPMEVLDDEGHRVAAARDARAGSGSRRRGASGPIPAARPAGRSWAPAGRSSGHEATELLGRGSMSASSSADRRSEPGPRSASAMGANGRPSSEPMLTQPPSRTRSPRSRARPASSSTSRLLPIPASPPMSTTTGVPVRRRRERVVELCHLGDAADQDRTRQSSAHLSDRSSSRVARRISHSAGTAVRSPQLPRRDLRRRRVRWRSSGWSGCRAL